MFERQPNAVVAILRRDNTWVFERRGRSHASLWQELKHLLTPKAEVPPLFLEIFDYVTSYGPYGLQDERELVGEGIDQTSSMRHDALYLAYGSDDFAVDAVMNMEGGGGAALEGRARAYEQYATGLRDLVLTEIAHMLDTLGDLLADHRTSMLPSIFTPSFDWSPSVASLSAGTAAMSRRVHRWVYGSPPRD